MTMNQKRSSDVIMNRILEVCSTGACKTKIIYQCNLNSTTIMPYLVLLMDNNLIETNDEEPKLYKTTPTGIQLMKGLKQHYEAISMLRSSMIPAV
jgi:predicted transcriptional regulator